VLHLCPIPDFEPDVAMSWEARGRGTSYYTRSKRVNGVVVRQYVGAGVLGEIAARTDAERRRRRETERAMWRVEKERIEEFDADLDQLCRLTDLLVEAVLTDAGYDKHKGEWRRKRAERDARQAAAGRSKA
jgi:hypothetical protein